MSVTREREREREREISTRWMSVEEGRRLVCDGDE